jgi:type IV pilus assembly protein PilB
MSQERIQDELKKEGELSIINLVDIIIESAHGFRSSDIHIDPLDDSVRIRMRIDGILRDVTTLPKSVHHEIISRIKILSNLRTDEHQKTQDGRFRAELKDAGPVDIRVSIAPTYHGENCVLRLLADKNTEYTLDNLGFSESNKAKIIKAIRRPHGMILVTGPTGSGKTTTLYAIIQRLNTKDVSIITIEDPIEYAIGGIEQVQVNTKAGLTFASGLRSFLRQDPNIIMVGEIRDSETASLAVNTALTGHLLLSTLHTNDAATTLPRLLDMGVESFLVASTVNIAIGQRLVRKICPKCKKEKKLSPAELKSITEIIPAELINESDKFYEGKGCDNCQNSGYQGRIAVHEVLVIDNDIRDAILNKVSATDIKQIAIKNGMITMTQDGVEKAKAGLTTLDEIIRVTHD